MCGILLLALAAVPGLAFSCPTPKVCELFDNQVLFVGEVIAGGVGPRKDPWHSKSTRARLRVLESFRGFFPGIKTLDLELSPTDGMCSPNIY